jgi:uncharacterized membrane protein YoaK (UPF0700 family)
MKRHLIVNLLSFNGGFVDTAGFLGLQGLFTAHVTGNVVTLAYALVNGSHGVTAKLIALPEFVVVVALARLIGAVLRAAKLPDLKILFGVQVALLFAFFAVAVRFGPFPDSDSPPALVTGFAGIAAMAVQNAVHRVHFAALPPTTLMTGNTTQAIMDAVDLVSGVAGSQTPAIRLRLSRLLAGIGAFAAGCGAAAVLYAWIGFWCLAVPVMVGAIAAIVRVTD